LVTDREEIPDKVFEGISVERASKKRKKRHDNHWGSTTGKVENASNLIFFERYSIFSLFEYYI